MVYIWVRLNTTLCSFMLLICKTVLQLSHWMFKTCWIIHNLFKAKFYFIFIALICLFYHLTKFSAHRQLYLHIFLDHCESYLSSWYIKNPGGASNFVWSHLYDQTRKQWTYTVTNGCQIPTVELVIDALSSLKPQHRDQHAPSSANIGKQLAS